MIFNLTYYSPYEPKQEKSISQIMKNEVFESWIDQYFGLLLKKALYMLSNKEDAQDIVQDVFTAAFSNYESFEGKSQPLTWLMTILRTKIADFYSKKYKLIINAMPNHFFDEVESWKNNDVWNSWNVSTEPDLLDNPDFKKALEECIEELPYRWRVLFKMYYFEEQKATEVCQELNISTTNLWKILQRSRMQLRESLELKWFSRL